MTGARNWLDVALPLRAHDLDADGARLLVELLDPDPNARRARMRQAMLRHLLGNGLDQMDMAAREDGLDAVDDGVVVEGAGRCRRRARRWRACTSTSTEKRTRWVTPFSLV